MNTYILLKGFEMKSSNLFMIALLGLTGSYVAQATTLSYEHDYEDVSKQHTDEFSISHHFAFGVKASVGLKFEPDEKENGDADKAFNHNHWHETKLGLSYPVEITKNLTLQPGFSWGQKHDEHKYKPYLKLKYSVTPNLELSSRYRYEVTDYKYKDTKYKNRLDLGASRKCNKLKVGYTLSLYHGNTDLYDNNQHDYEHKLAFSYKLTKSISPYISFKNESVSSHSDKRQTEYTVGLDYKF